jgi:hypothetical protein
MDRVYVDMEVVVSAIWCIKKSLRGERLRIEVESGSVAFVRGSRAGRISK